MDLEGREKLQRLLQHLQDAAEPGGRPQLTALRERVPVQQAGQSRVHTLWREFTSVVSLVCFENES